MKQYQKSVAIQGTLTVSQEFVTNTKILNLISTTFPMRANLVITNGKKIIKKLRKRWEQEKAKSDRKTKSYRKLLQNINKILTNL